MIDAGKTYGEIASALGIRRNMVAGVVHRDKLKKIEEAKRGAA